MQRGTYKLLFFYIRAQTFGAFVRLIWKLLVRKGSLCKEVNCSDVAFCIKTLRCVSSSGGGLSEKRVLRLASFMGGAENEEIRSFTVPRDQIMKWFRLCRES